MSEKNNEFLLAKIGVIAAVLVVIGDFLALILAIIALKEVLNQE